MGKKLIALYEEAGREHRFILNWRYGIIAGLLTISGLLYSKLLDKTDNDIIISFGGLLISIIFFLLHLRTSKLLWNSKNCLRGLEKELEKENKDFQGVYSYDKDNPPPFDERDSVPELIKGLFFNLGHTGIINWTIVLLGSGFLVKLISLICICNHCCCHCCY